MKTLLEIQMKLGSDVSSQVNEFYLKNGTKHRARPHDLFFLGLQDGSLKACVRYCVEENTPMLRSMMVDQDVRGQGVGLQILKAFEQFLLQNKIQNTYCIPYAHLEKFYGHIGFKLVDEKILPDFLKERLQTYRALGKSYLCVKRD